MLAIRLLISQFVQMSISKLISILVDEALLLRSKDVPIDVYPESFEIVRDSKHIYINGNDINPKVIEQIKQWVDCNTVIRDGVTYYYIGVDDELFLTHAALHYNQTIKEIVR